MDYIELQACQLAIDPKNYRGVYDGIDELKESIAQHGLLQNLVVTLPEAEGGPYVVKGGNRRLIAINALQDEGRMPREEPIMCLIVDDTPWVALAENVNRRDVAPWRVGWRYLELLDAGFTGLDIAGKLSISSGTVSNYMAIARGLHPDIIAKCERMGWRSLSKANYRAIARCLDDWGEPHLKNQELLLKKLLEARVPKIRKAPRKKHLDDMTPAERVMYRFRSLQSGNIQIPNHALLFVLPILQFLSDGTKPKFPPPITTDIEE